MKSNLSRRQFAPVVKSFKEFAAGLKPNNKLQAAMGDQAWRLQVDKAGQDFENYLFKTAQRILGQLKNNGYAPNSAMNQRPRPMDVAQDKRVDSKASTKSTHNIKRILGVS